MRWALVWLTRTLACFRIEIIWSIALQCFRTLTLALASVPSLSVWAALWWIVWALALAVFVIKLVWCATFRTGFWTLTLARFTIEHFPMMAPKLLGTLTLARFWIEYLCWIGAITILIGARTVAAILVKDIRCWTVFLPSADAVARFVAKGLTVGTAFDARTGALAVPLIELVRCLARSFMITFTHTCFFVEYSRFVASNFPWTFAFACVWIKNLSLWALAIVTFALAFAWVEFLTLWALLHFTYLTLAC